MPLLVMKFGGTSVADLDRIKNAALKVKREVERGYDVIVIVSAMSGKTNELVGWVEATSPLFDAREYDAVVASGENVTAGLMALTLQEMDVPARSWQGWQVPINTTAQHSSARFVDIPRKNIDQKFAEGMKVAVVAGFQGLSPEGRVTTLGRGGSDTTAVAFAAAFGAERCDIYTDVDGVYTTDPRITSKARKLDKIAFEEMLELASLGAKVLQTRSVELAMRYKVRLRVLSSFEDTDETSGTLVCDEDEIMESKVVNGVAYSREEAKITLVTVEDKPGISAAIFAPLAEAGVNVDMIVQNISEKDYEDHPGSVTDMTFSCPVNQVARAKKALEEAIALAFRTTPSETEAETTASPLSLAYQERLARLTAREREVMDLVVAGSYNKVIAYDLGISPKTVELHRARIMTKMEAPTLTHLVRMAVSGQVEEA